jgi:protein-S-isoprenylcysteine O-methyltransferase Ste14
VVTAVPAAVDGRLDWGRMAVVPLVALLLFGDVVKLAGVAEAQSGGVAVTASVLASLLTIAFYVLLIACYLRRGPASATTRSVTAKLAAVTATWLPLTLPLVWRPAAGVVPDLGASVLVLAGLGWSLWSLAALGRNLSIVAQARGLATSGPYRWVRHPLYVGELVAMLGVVLRAGEPAALGMWLVLVGLQTYRAVTEERLLTASLPGYDGYRRRTGRFLPRLRYSV